MNKNDVKVECFVLNCNQRVGVPFPKNENLKNEWLKVLQQNGTNTELVENSFLCLDHFHDSDFEEDPDGGKKFRFHFYE